MFQVTLRSLIRTAWMTDPWSSFVVPSGHTQNILLCQKELVGMTTRVEKERADKEKLAKEVKDLRAKVLHLEKEKGVLTKRLGVELANEHGGEAAAAT